jgi:uncharacterized RDD family membrane protein YckC
MSDSLPAPSLKRRFACLLYEFLLMSAVLLTAVALITPLKAALPPSFWLDQLIRLFLLAVLFGYFGLSWVRSGQTVAMKAWRLQLQDRQGLRLRWKQAALRFSVAIMLFIGIPVIAYLGSAEHSARVARLSLLWVLLPYLYAWFDPQGQALQDRLCGTRVVLLPGKKRAKRLQSADSPADGCSTNHMK